MDTLLLQQHQHAGDYLQREQLVAKAFAQYPGSIVNGLPAAQYSSRPNPNTSPNFSQARSAATRRTARRPASPGSSSLWASAA